MTTPGIRPPAVAGTFYPSRSSLLSRDVDRMLDQAGSPRAGPGHLVAIIAPHAGYMYSGPTAARAYGQLTSPPDSVVIASPSHREYFDGISVFSGEGYRTPLGDVSVDRALRDELLRNDTVISASVRGHGDEHAVEVHLPFLQRAIGKIRFRPIVLGDQHPEYCFHLGITLSEILKGKNAVLIASSDLSHYHPYGEAEQLDQVFIGDVRAFDPERLMEHLEDEVTEACGGGPTVAVMVASKLLGADRVEILHHCNSGDVTGDHSQVVGYLAASITRTN